MGLEYICQKISYRTKLSAWRASVILSTRFKLQTPYKCPNCKKYHLTTQERTTKIATMPYRVGSKLNSLKARILFNPQNKK